MGKLTRLSNKILNTPHLLTAEYLDFVSGYLQDRNSEDITLAVGGGRERKKEELAYNPDTEVGVLSIDGPLTYLEYSPICGEEPTSYQRLEREMEALITAGAKTIVYDVDSPGGEAYGCFETANRLRTLAKDNGVRTVAYVDGLAASAAYGLVVAADEIIVNPMAEVGSIGVVVSLANFSEAEKKFGVERTYVYAGANKIPYDENGKFTKEFLADIQNRVDSLYVDFIGHVAEMRNLTPESVRDTQAKVFSAKDAQAIGLIDSTMTREEFFTYLSEVVENTGNTPMGIKSSLFKLNSNKEDSFDMNELEQAQAAMADLSTELEAKSTQLADLLSEKEQLQANLAEMQATLASYEAAKAEAEAKAKEMKVAARKAALESKVGEEKAASLMTSLESLDDTAFEAVVSAMATSLAVEEQSDEFKEVGMSGEGNLDEDGSLSLVSKLINEKKTAK